MKYCFALASFLLLCSPVFTSGQELENALQERKLYYDRYQQKRADAVDTTVKSRAELAGIMEDVLRIDNLIIDQYFFKEYDRANDLSLENDNLKKRTEALEDELKQRKIWVFVSVSASGFLIIALLLFIYLYVIARSRSKRLELKTAQYDSITDHAMRESEALREELSAIKDKVLSDDNAWRQKTESMERELGRQIVSLRAEAEKFHQAAAEKNLAVEEKLKLEEEIGILRNDLSALSEKYSAENIVAEKKITALNDRIKNLEVSSDALQREMDEYKRSAADNARYKKYYEEMIRMVDRLRNDNPEVS